MVLFQATMLKPILNLDSLQEQEMVWTAQSPKIQPLNILILGVSRLFAPIHFYLQFLYFPLNALTTLKSHTYYIMPFTFSDALHRSIKRSHGQWLYEVHLLFTERQKKIHCYPSLRSGNLLVKDSLCESHTVEISRYLP